MGYNRKRSDRTVDPLEERLHEIARMIETEPDDETFNSYTRMMIKHFRRYSVSNTFLILIQRPEATCVNAASRWNELGWQVLPNEVGMKIRVPKGWSKDIVDDKTGEEKTINGTSFPMIGRVFDISQCEKIPDFEGEYFDPAMTFEADPGEDAKPILDALVTIAEENDYPISFKRIGFAEGNAMGYASKSWTGERKIVIDNLYPSGVQACVAIHEVAHQQLHLCKFGETEMAHALREGEAEAVSCLVMHHFGFDVGANSAAYIRNHGCKYTAIMNSMRRILECSNWIIDRILEVQDNG